jgi:hypothetical protein
MLFEGVIVGVITASIPSPLNRVIDVTRQEKSKLAELRFWKKERLSAKLTFDVPVDDGVGERDASAIAWICLSEFEVLAKEIVDVALHP